MKRSAIKRTEFKRAHKYGAVPTSINGVHFGSKMEAKRYEELLWMEKGRLITNIARQQRFEFWVNGVHVCDWKVDFTYRDTETGQLVADDPGLVDKDKRMKAALLCALYPEYKLLINGEPWKPKRRRK